MNPSTLIRHALDTPHPTRPHPPHPTPTGVDALALHHLQHGRVTTALYLLGIINDDLVDRTVAHKDTNPLTHHYNMNHLANELEELGF